MQPLKICIIGPAWPLRGGIAALNESLARELAKIGHGVAIYSFSLQYPSFLFPGTTQFDNISAPPKDLQITTCINSVNPFNWVASARKIRKEKPDLVIIRFWLPFMGPCLGTVARLVKRNSTTQIIALVDNAIPHEKRLGDSLFTRWFFSGCHAFIALSQKVVRDIGTFRSDVPIKHTPHPVYDQYGEKTDKETARKYLGIPLGVPVVLFFGFIRKYKGLDLLLESIADERLGAKNVHILIAGEFYEDEKTYQDLIDRLNIRNRVILRTNYIANEDVRYYFCAADIVAQTYRNATNSGIAKIAIHFDKPSLVTDVGGLPEDVDADKNGYVTACSSESIANALNDYYDNNRELSFTNHLLEHKYKYAWSYMTHTICSLYSDLNEHK
ncbi:MAG: glycosyltransferase [Bacteroidia bacterium]